MMSIALGSTASPPCSAGLAIEHEVPASVPRGPPTWWDAVGGADFVLCAIPRRASSKVRVVDESVPLGHGVAGPGDHRPRAASASRLRTIPGDDGAGRDDGPARAGGVADQLHQPGRDGHRGRPARARRPRDRHLRLPRRPSSAASPARWTADHSELWFRLLRPQPPRLAARRARTATASCCPRCWRPMTGSGTFEEGRLFGGEWAALAGR